MRDEDRNCLLGYSLRPHWIRPEPQNGSERDRLLVAGLKPLQQGLSPNEARIGPGSLLQPQRLGDIPIHDQQG